MPNKDPCAQVLLLVAQRPDRFVTGAEVLQELLHRYTAISRWTEGRAVFQRFATLMKERIEPVYTRDVQHAASLADQYSNLSARDLIHITVMARVQTTRIVSTDRDFEAVLI